MQKNTDSNNSVKFYSYLFTRTLNSPEANCEVSTNAGGGERNETQTEQKNGSLCVNNSFHKFIYVQT
jgi:hypothetical protein